jgi:hypothetical protein
MPFSFIKKITLHLVVFKQTNKRSRKPKGQSRDTDNVEHRTKKNHIQHQQPGVNSNAREEAFLIVQIKGFFFKKRFI